MTCQQCGQDNRDSAKFCLTCGGRLILACASCGAELPAGAKFCDECGTRLSEAADGRRGSPPTSDSHRPTPDPRTYTPPHLADKILQSKSALQGERKQVAVLFADVVGSTALAERLDPEIMHGIMDGCFRLLMDEVHRYEGTVNQFTGDGIMALFGAPIAHEDASERAVRAALGMQAALRGYGEELRSDRGIDFRMRIGINTGLVVVGKIGDDLRMDYTAIGDTVNLAARLQTAATPGAIFIGEQTAKLVTGRFATRVVGPLALKGKSEPVHAEEVLRALPRLPLVGVSKHGLTPLVGRDAELTALQTVFEHVRAGHGQIAFVVGEAGIGKSRLLHEFRRRLDDADVTWLVGRCVSFGRAIPLLPVADLVKARLGIEEADSESDVVDKVRNGLNGFGPELQGAEPHLRALLAVDPGDTVAHSMEASARRFATFDALKRLLLASATHRPLVVVIEDLHWIDQASEEFLTYIVDALAAARILLLCTFRSGYRPTLGERSYATRIALQPLSAVQTIALAAGMLDVQAVPPEIRALLAHRAEGNPFFAEEVTKSLLEIGALLRTDDGYALGRPVDEIIIPDRIQDVIMARIDRLGDESKHAMQVASVIGREFAVRLLQRAAELGERIGPLVGELRSLELIYEKSGVPELAYMFKHALTHDVAYESLLLQRRKQLHGIIGRAVEELYADRLAEYWETLAYHFYRSEDWPRAFDYLLKAADKARGCYANSEALYFYKQALEAATHIVVEPAQHATILEGKGRAHFCLSEFPQAVDAFREAMTLLPGPADQARLGSAMAEALVWMHEFDDAVAGAEAALAHAESAGEISLAGLAKSVIGFVGMLRGNLEQAAGTFAEIARLADHAGDAGLRARDRIYAALRANWRGEYRPAIADYAQVLPELRSANELLMLVEVYSHFTITLGGAGDYEAVLRHLADGIALSESIGDKVWRARMWNTRGWLLGELGAYDAAEEANHRCLEFMQQLGSMRFASEFVANAEINLADAALWRGNLAAAEPHLSAVAAILADTRNEWMTWRYGMHYHATAAELAVARGDLGNARTHLAACQATAQRTRSRRYLVRSNRLLAACHSAAGDLTASEEILTRTVADARVLGNPTQLWHALLAYGRVLYSLGRRDDATAVWREGLQNLDTVRRILPDQIRSALAESPVATAFSELT